MTPLVALKDNALSARPHSLLWQASVRLSTFLGLLLLAFVWAGTYLYLRLDHETSLEKAVTSTANMARVFEEHVERELKNVDQTLLFLRRSYEADPAAFDLPAWTSSNYLLNDIVLQMSLIGPDGMLRTTNLVKNPDHVDLSDREHFRVHAVTDKDELFISKPVLGRASGKWSVQLTRRISRPDGGFDGVLVASLDPFYLSRFFGQIDLGSKGALTLLGDDGIIRVRGGLNAGILGQDLSGTDYRRDIGTAHAGHFIGVDPIDKVSRIVSYRELNSFPLIVTAAMAEDEVFAGYVATRTLVLAIAAALSAIILGVLGYGTRRELTLLAASLAHRRSEQLVARRSSELEATLAHMSQGIVMLAENGTLCVINHRARQLLDVSDTPLGALLPASVAAVIETNRALFDGEVITREVTLADDTVVEIGSTRLPDGGILHAISDITSRKRYESVLAEARDRAEAASRARTAFLATMSHEIRTPLNGIIGMTELIDSTQSAEDRADSIAKMRRSADHLLKVIDDVLDLSRIEAGGEVLASAPFDLNDTIASVVDIVADHARQKSLKVETLVAPNTPTELIGDPRHIRQILLNLVGNAVKFTDVGGVIIRAEVLPGQSSQDHSVLRLRVQDTGIGIARDELPKLFQDFSQLDGSLTRRFGGSGLGLSISRKLAQKLGGDIAVESRVGAGTVFTVRLPILVGNPDAAAQPVDTEAASRQPKSTYSGLRVLLVEDDAINTLVCKGILNRMGNDVVTAVDGIEAFDRLKAQRFDLILMDVMMPRMDGLTATRKIRAGVAPYSRIPIIALTADAMLEDRERAFAAGVDGYTTKPVSRQRLQNVIDDVMGRSGVKPPVRPFDPTNVVTFADVPWPGETVEPTPPRSSAGA